MSSCREGWLVICRLTKCGRSNNAAGPDYEMGNFCDVLRPLASMFS